MDLEQNNADSGNPDASNVANQQNQAVDISQGVPLVQQPPAQSNVDSFNQASDASVDGNQAPVVPDGEVKDYQAINERLMQQNAKNARVMSALGVDPMSDLGDQLENGIITAEQLKNHYTGNQQPVQQQPATQTNDPVQLAMAAQAEAEKAYNEEAAAGGISIETNNRLREADRAVSQAQFDSVRQQVVADKQSQQINANVNAVLGVVHNDANYTAMDDKLKGSVDLATIAMTGVIADQQARQIGIDPQNMSSQQAAYFAQQANEQLDALAQHYMQLGANQVRAGQNLAPNVNRNQFIPNPVGNNNAPPAQQPNPYKNTTMKDHRQRASEYAAGNRGM